uniref:Uncharacterized protein n=1 Tax=Anguilla anguilla TaxID=7936 RepID=A0A0E9TLN5_ANGAN
MKRPFSNQRFRTRSQHSFCRSPSLW